MPGVVVEVRFWPSTGRCVFVENLATGAGVLRVRDAVRRWIVHHIIEERTPTAEVDVRLRCFRCNLGRYLRDLRIEALAHGTKRRNRRRQKSQSKMPGAKGVKLFYLSFQVAYSRRALELTVIQTAGKEEERGLGIELDFS